jgi:hypothetical protein
MAPSSIGDDQLGVDLETRPEPVTVRAGPVRRVEGEVARRRFVEGATVDRAGQVLGEGEDLLLALVACHELDGGDPLGQPEGRLQRVGQPALDALAAHQAVDDDLNGVLLVPGELGDVTDLVDLAVDAGPTESLTRQLVEQRLVLTFAAPHDRRQDLEAGPLGQLQDPVHDLLGCLTLDHGPVIGTVRDADPGVEETEVVVDLGDGPDRRAGVARRRLLVDRDRRRQALDEVDVRLVHLPEKLAGVARQRLDVAALALGVDRVEGERALARSRQAGEDDQLVTGQFQRDVAEIVLPGASDDQLLGH